MRRVLHVHKFLDDRGGAERALHDLCGRQRSRGSDVVVWGMADPADPASAAHPYAAQLAPYFDLEASAGVVGRLRTAGRTLWSETSRRRLASVLDDFRPDVVHVHNVYHHLSPSVLQPMRARGIPVAMTVHDYKLVCPSYHLLAGDELCTRCLDGRFRHAVETRCKGSLGASAVVALEARVHRSLRLYDPVDVLICPSRFMEHTLRSAGLPGERLAVLPHPVDAAAMPLKDAPGGPVVYAGRLGREKGVDVLLRAVGMVPGARLEVLGDGPERRSLEVMAADVAPGRVTFLGAVPHPEVLRRIRTATVVAVPARWPDNQSLVVLEALASGVPVVASALGGLVELVEDGVDGLLVRHGDPTPLAAALDDLLAHPDRAWDMGRAGRVEAERRFHPERHLDRVDALYARAAEAAAGRASASGRG